MRPASPGSAGSIHTGVCPPGWSASPAVGRSGQLALEADGSESSRTESSTENASLLIKTLGR